MRSDSFNNLLESYWSQGLPKEDKLIHGKILRINKHFLTVDIGEKKPIQIPASFIDLEVKSSQALLLQRDYLFGIDNKKKATFYSIVGAEPEQDLEDILLTISQNKDHVNGLILNEVKGGYSVGIGGIVAFLPKSQIAIASSMPLKETNLNRLKTFSILSLNKKKKNIVVSRLKMIQQNKKLRRK